MNHAHTLLSLVFAGLAGSVLAQPQPAISPMQGLSTGQVKVLTLDQLDPATRGMAERDLGLQQSAAKSGEPETVPDQAATFKTQYASRAVYWEESKIRANLKSDWTDVSASELQGYKYEAFVPEGPSKAGPWSRYTRVYTRPDGVLVMLHEWDYVQDGGGVVLIKELMNAQVHQHLARVVTRKTTSGQHFSELTWVTDRKYYTLTVWDRLDARGLQPYDRSWLVSLAEQLSGAEPGRR